ncbi:MAG: sigma 54-interacting transcriptional regulator, partial [Oscillospiraceae bacterium]|nr:sigma 54-interacting transcriptional regulator [Oscillospiraceae bacterium]
VTVNFAKGQLLSDIAANLSPNGILGEGRQSAESYKILNGIRFRCQQNRLVSNGQDIGVVTSLRIDNTVHKEKAAPGTASGAARWKELVAVSDSMKEAISLGKKYAASPLPLALVGDVSAHRQIFAECVHTGGPRAQGPLIMVNLPQISTNDAGRHLLGCSDVYAPHTGLIELANNGTLVLKNVQDACPAVQDILLDVLAHSRIIPTGGYEPIEVNVRFISIFDRPLAEEKIRSDLLRRLCTLCIELPLLSERKDDLPVLFHTALSSRYERSFQISHYKKAEDILKLYSWPGNTSELEAVAGRFATALNSGAKITAYTVQNMLIQAIGEEQLFQELIRLHPCLTQKNPESEALRAAVGDIKRYLGYNNATIAERLGISRSSLWRVLKEKEE